MSELLTITNPTDIVTHPEPVKEVVWPRKRDVVTGELVPMDHIDIEALADERWRARNRVVFVMTLTVAAWSLVGLASVFAHLVFFGGAQ